MLNAAMHSMRLNNMTQAHRNCFNVLSSTVGKNLSTIALALGLSQEDVEKQLSALIDETLASRTTGGRTTALYLAL